MTAERQETVADVVRVMRNETFRRNGKRSLDVERYMHLYADRIEAAHKREQDAHNAFLTGVAQGIIDEKKKHDAEMRRVGKVVVVNDIPTDNSTKTQKDGVLSFGADGAAPAGQGQGNWEHVGKLPWIVDYCWDIRDANGYVIAKVNENLSEEAYKRMCEFIAAAANATAGPCNAAKLRMALEKMATWANEEGCEYCVGDREQMAKQALEEAPRNCDVGTLDEQIDRFIVFCESHGTCIECELSDGCRARQPSCDLAWGQLPYTEGGDHADA